MTRSERIEFVEDFIDIEPPDLYPGLDSLLYAINESGLWEDCVDSVSEEQAILCWRIVESVRNRPFPEDFDE